MPRNLSLAELAALFGLSPRTMRLRLAEMEGEGFPLPLPWNRRKRFWNAKAVLDWKERQERAAKCLPNQPMPLTLVRPHQQEAAR